MGTALEEQWKWNLSCFVFLNVVGATQLQLCTWAVMLIADHTETQMLAVASSFLDQGIMVVFFRDV